MALEDEFDITVEEEELEGIETVGQAFGLVTAKLGPPPSHGARRVAVTGVGVLSSCGTGVDAFWAGLIAPPPRANDACTTATPRRSSTTRRRLAAPTG